jgi:hypothetical protein
MRDQYAIWMPSPHFCYGRLGYTPKWLILHGTAGGSSAQNIATWFQDPASMVSSHYVIGQDGTIVQCVDENDWAWANGFLSNGHDPWWVAGVNPNLTTISIEHVKPDTNNDTPLTPAQQAASFALIERICRRWNIPMRAADSTGGITGHFSLDPVNRAHCPGNFPWDELWQTLEKGQPQPDMLDITDPLIAHYFSQIAPDRWRCKTNGVDLIGANLIFYRTYGGVAVFGLPLYNEVYPSQFPGVALAICERGIIAYDPKRTMDNAPISGPCYLVHLDSGLGQQIVAHPLVQPLQGQISSLQSQLAQAKQQNNATSQTTEAAKQLAAMKTALAAIAKTAQPFVS